MKRATGRTYRFALSACLAMSEGKDVLWVCGNHAESVPPAALMQRLLAGYSVPGSITWVVFNDAFSARMAGHPGYDLVIEDELLGCTWRGISEYLEVKARCNGFLKR
jgi:hypothetical protein